MNIIAIVDSYQGALKKSAAEVVSYAHSLAQMLNASFKTVAINTENPTSLGAYGAAEILNITLPNTTVFSEKNYAEAVLSHTDATVYILSHSMMGSGIAAQIAVKKQASLISNVIALPQTEPTVQFKRKSFAGKVNTWVHPTQENWVITVSPNAFGTIANPIEAKVQALSFESTANPIQLIERQAPSGKVNLKEAEIVVAGGMGLKSPENFKMIEELADALGGAVACTKPVSENGWRPHAEHTGQTGTSVAPNLYIAVGISGAIQHLAGVNGSKKILVINNDPDAPFFKAADYGICADAFEVVPELTRKIREKKAKA